MTRQLNRSEFELLNFGKSKETHVHGLALTLTILGYLHKDLLRQYKGNTTAWGCIKTCPINLYAVKASMMSSCFWRWCLISIWCRINSSLCDTVKLLFYWEVHMVTDRGKLHFVLLITDSTIAQTILFTLKPFIPRIFPSPDYSPRWISRQLCCQWH